MVAAVGAQFVFTLAAGIVDLPAPIRAPLFALIATFTYATTLLPASDERAKRLDYVAHSATVLALGLSGMNWLEAEAEDYTAWMLFGAVVAVATLAVAMLGLASRLRNQ